MSLRCINRREKTLKYDDNAVGISEGLKFETF